MSSPAYAYSLRPTLPMGRPQETPRRLVEVVTTKAQRRARPRSFYAVITVSGVFALLLIQLLLSIVLSAGAYQISGLQASQVQLSRIQESLSEKLDLLSSPQSLSTKASGLGMVVNSATPMFIRLSDGTIVGAGSATSGAQGAPGTTTSLVPNSLLDSTVPTESAASVVSQSGAPSSPNSSSYVASSDGALTSPVTR